MRLWYAYSYNAQLLAPLSVYVSATPPMIGAATALLNATLGAPCASVTGAASGSLQLAFPAPCSGRYVIVQMTDTTLSSVWGGAYMAICALQARACRRRRRRSRGRRRRRRGAQVIGSPGPAVFPLSLTNAAYKAPAARDASS